MINFDKQLKDAKRKYEEKVKSIKYWECVYKDFQKQKNKNVETFKKEFKHTSKIFDEFQPDDELKIEAYAADCGYKIIDEEIKSNKSIYTFHKI